MTGLDEFFLIANRLSIIGGISLIVISILIAGVIVYSKRI